MAAAGHLGTRGVPRAEREDQILDAAVAEFGARGYAGGSVAAIAAAAGISKPLVYGYFGSRDGLYLACLRRAAGTLFAAIAAAPAEPTLRLPIETLRAIFTALAARPHDWSVIHDRTPPPDGEAARTAAEIRAQFTGLAAGGVRELLGARGNTDLLDRSALTEVWIHTVTALVQWWLDHPGETADDMTARCERLLSVLG